MADASPTQPRPILRQCIACRQLHPRQEMLRLTYSQKAQRFSINDNPPLEGRSAYVCRRHACLTDALKGKRFQRTLKRAIPDDIVNCLNEQLKGLIS